jgi:hypothetical protein
MLEIFVNSNVIINYDASFREAVFITICLVILQCYTNFVFTKFYTVMISDGQELCRRKWLRLCSSTVPVFCSS